MKRVYFIRHGEADWPDFEGADDERPLTEYGRKQVKRVAKFLRRAGAQPLLIFTSPLPRAAQTAAIVAKVFAAELGVEHSLGKGFDAEKFQALVIRHDVSEIAIVGHEPDFTGVLSTLTGANVVLAKAGVALVELDESATSGKLRWLFPPRLARKR